MGTFTVAMGLPDGTDLNALVDTAATFSKLPAKVLRRLGVRPDFATTVELGDGRLIRRRVGYVRLSLGRKQAPVPVMFGGSREEALVGATTLEILGLAPDPVRRRLVESRHLEVSERRARSSTGSPSRAKLRSSMPRMKVPSEMLVRKDRDER